VETPLPIVKLLWGLVNLRRRTVETVVDFGAGDGRFAWYGRYRRYVGYELDPAKIAQARLGRKATLHQGCVLSVKGHFSAAVGNPPFIRNQDLGILWRRRAQALISEEISGVVDPFSNLYLYFMWLALARTTAGGILALVVPFDWTYRPSARSLREFIRRRGWRVDVYRLEGSQAYFPGVKTTATITIVDKAVAGAGINVWMTAAGRENRPAQAVPQRNAILAYRPRGQVFARRGFSPGSQDVFVLTESERVEAGIPPTAVVPCVTSLRGLPGNLTVLNAASFKRLFVRGGRKCWLLKTAQTRLAAAVTEWLDGAPSRVKDNTTCRSRRMWFRYPTTPAPRILMASGFRSAAPRLILNAVEARNLGSVFGIFGLGRDPGVNTLLRRLLRVDFKAGIPADARGFRRIEVRQVNGVLERLCSRRKSARDDD
jgi:hypothetical protein